MACSRMNVLLKGPFSDVEYTALSGQGESIGIKVEISSRG